jgi:ribonuclease D
MLVQSFPGGWPGAPLGFLFRGPQLHLMNRNAREMSHFHVQSPADTDGLAADLGAARRIGLDCEAAGFHRYSDRLCLVQLTTERGTYVIDALGFDPRALLKGALEDPDVPVVMHGADFDLRLLRRDLGIRLRGLFDTQIAAQLLGGETLGLAGLLEARLGVSLSKKYQRADWAERPLPNAMLEYAADDTRYLTRLADILADELARAGRSSWAEEECRALEAAAESSPDASEREDPVVRIRGARHLTPRQLTALREALRWRDEIARERDRAPFRIVAEGPLIEAVAARPKGVADLVEVKGFPTRLAHEDGAELIRRLDAVAEMKEQDLAPYPKPTHRGPGRPSQDLEALAEKLKRVRNRKAEQIGLPRGTLLANAVVLDVARAAPTDIQALLAVEGMRRWKAEVLGDDLLTAIRGAV